MTVKMIKIETENKYWTVNSIIQLQGHDQCIKSWFLFILECFWRDKYNCSDNIQLKKVTKDFLDKIIDLSMTHALKITHTWIIINVHIGNYRLYDELSSPTKLLFLLILSPCLRLWYRQEGVRFCCLSRFN